MKHAEGNIDKIVSSKVMVKSKSPRQPTTAGPIELSPKHVDMIRPAYAVDEARIRLLKCVGLAALPLAGFIRFYPALGQANSAHEAKRIELGRQMAPRTDRHWNLVQRSCSFSCRPCRLPDMSAAQIF